MVRQIENRPQNGEKLDDGAGGKWTDYVVHRTQWQKKVAQYSRKKLDSIFTAGWAGVVLGTAK